VGVIRAKAGELVTIGDFGITGYPTMTTNGFRVPDPGIPLNQYTPGHGYVDPVKMWKQHPSLRKVVSFAAEQIASIPWHVYKRNDDTDRERMSGSAAEKRLNEPAHFITGFMFWRDICIDWMLSDRYAIVSTGTELLRIPPEMLDIRTNPLGIVTAIFIVDGKGDFMRNSRTGEVINWVDGPICVGWGWSGAGAGGISPLITLWELLDESSRAVAWRSSKWETQPKFTGYLTRPAGVWDPKKRERFITDWDKWKQLGVGTPILEDGMEYKDRDASAVDPEKAKDLEGRKLTDEQVASAYGIAPELVGARPGNFSNMQAFRQMLFGPTLGPKFQQLGQSVNQMLLPLLDTTAGLYAEQDRDAAINGSLIEQAEVLSKLTGGPIMSVAEARAKLNLRYKEGTDDIVTPLNVVRGGGPQASPEDAGDQNRDISNPPPAKTKAISAPARVAKAATPAKQREALHAAISDVMAAQQAATRGKITPAQFHKQWDAVMADALASGLQAAAVTAALRVLKANNPSKEGWSAEVMDGYLAAMADTTAHGINAGVVQLVNDYEADDVEEHTADAAFEVAKESNAKAWAYTAITAAAGFGGHDAAKASGMKRKTWIVQSSNPRASHAAMDGETVGVGEEFSNGAQWPGDISLPVEESAGCACGVEFEI
jgi:phage portal protein BeeE